MKWSFEPTILIPGSIQVMGKVGQEVQKAEEDGKLDKKELASIAFTAVMEALIIMAQASKIDGKPLFPGSGTQSGGSH